MGHEMRWQVGDGKRINVWKDKWIPSPRTYKVMMPERLQSQTQWVCDFIDEDRKEWKGDLVRQCFLPQDAEAILSIPLSVNGIGDRIIWAENKNGRFLVKRNLERAKYGKTRWQAPEWPSSGEELTAVNGGFPSSK
ncbi:uncharacterized protein LOC142605956 [Castanea sativa]|uniref:uncharacterized protein LOC142605956 n=1 Tax=Castanea sativa TaxID=21020 RepID=UPI003F65314B